MLGDVLQTQKYMEIPTIYQKTRKQAQDRAKVADDRAGAVLQYYKTTVQQYFTPAPLKTTKRQLYCKKKDIKDIPTLYRKPKKDITALQNYSSSIFYTNIL